MWRIADLTLDSPVVLAPMAGITDLPFRLLVKEFGCGLVYGPLISAKAIRYGNRSTRRLLSIAANERPVGLQIFGSDPITMAEAAQYVAEVGPDLIDINMGCPAPKVVDNDDGCALMLNPSKAARVIEAVVKAVSIPVTVKIRKGWDEDRVTAVEIARLAEQAGAAAVCVHGRTRQQFYSGKADWSIIAAVRAVVEVPVIGNGDVGTPLDVQRMMQETGCSAVMIGRAALGNPWLFGQVNEYLETGMVRAGPTPVDRIGMAQRHLLLALELKGDRALFEIRKHLAWYLKGIPGANRTKEAVMRTESVDQVLTLLEELRSRQA